MQADVDNVLAKIGSFVLGKPHECRLALACLLAQGHLLIEDLPGMGKTTLAHVLANTLGLSYQRTQFTSDLLPADIIGFSIFNKDTNNFDLHKGPIFNQVVLADEINRASPKTQSALLEAMAEKQVSIDGTTHTLPTPFFVIATQNPLFHSGTYPLPESQLDRFMMRISLGFPDIAAEKQILLSEVNSGQSVNDSLKVIDIEQLKAMQTKVQAVHASNDVIEYIIALCRVSRGQVNSKLASSKVVKSKDKPFEETTPQEIICKSLSPRAGKALLSAAKAWAYINHRDYLLPEDVKAIFYAVCQHRIEMTGQAFNGNEYSKEASVSYEILNAVDVLNPLG